MTAYETVPLWAAVVIAFFLIVGSSLTLLGALGLARLRSFYDRLHAPTLGSSWGAGAILLASILLYSIIGGRLVIHEVVLGVFVMITAPVTLMLLGRTALHRDHLELQSPVDEIWAAPGDKEIEDSEERAEADDALQSGDPAADFTAAADIDKDEADIAKDAPLSPKA